jgi:hypothetical protein
MGGRRDAGTQKVEPWCAGVARRAMYGIAAGAGAAFGLASTILREPIGDVIRWGRCKKGALEGRSGTALGGLAVNIRIEAS